MTVVVAMAGAALWLVVAVAVAVRLRSATGSARGRLLWLVWAELVTVALVAVAVRGGRYWLRWRDVRGLRSVGAVVARKLGVPLAEALRALSVEAAETAQGKAIR